MNKNLSLEHRDKLVDDLVILRNLLKVEKNLLNIKYLEGEILETELILFLYN